MRLKGVKRIQRAHRHGPSSGGVLPWILWWSSCPQLLVSRWTPSLVLPHLRLVYAVFCFENRHRNCGTEIVNMTECSMARLAYDVQVLADWLYTVLAATFGLLSIVLTFQRSASITFQYGFQNTRFTYTCTCWLWCFWNVIQTLLKVAVICPCWSSSGESSKLITKVLSFILPIYNGTLFLIRRSCPYHNL